MKKLFFVAVAGMAIVSASNVFAFTNTPSRSAAVSDTDSVASLALVDTTDTAATPVSAVKEVALANDTDSTVAAHAFAFADFDQIDSVAPSTPDSALSQD